MSRQPWDALESFEITVGPRMPLRCWRPRGQTVPPRVVFIPGIASDGRAWYRQLELGARWPWIAPDIPLEVPEAPYVFPILALLLREIVHDLCTDPPVLVGSSFGGMLGLTYAHEFPDALTSLVLVGSAADARWFRWPFGLGYNLIRRAPGEAFRRVFPTLCALSGLSDAQDAEACRLFHLQARPFAPQHYANRLHAIGHLRLQDELSHIACPTLLVHGTGDHTIPHSASLRLARAMPRATLRILPGGSHSLYLRSHRWFNRTLQSWLSGELAC
ncbi:MAG: alpha/beta fold hydrolase [Candidatus Xenobia bacterium]